MEKKIEIGKIYRHFKGNYYFVENIGYYSENSSPVVIYKPIYDREEKIWVRPLDMFLEEIDINRKDNITGQKYRFELAEELSKDYTK